MNRIVVLGASILQVPAIKKAKEMGLSVAVVDYNEAAVGIQYADRYYNVSTIDEQGVLLAAKDFKADGIMTMATDKPMKSVAYACEKLGLSGITYDTAIKSTDKVEMMKAFAKENVNHPWFFHLKSIFDLNLIEDKLSYPCVCKPIDNSGSRGVILINDPTELETAVKFSSTQASSGGLILEEYLLGDEVSVEIAVVNSIAHVVAVTDKLTSGPPHFVEMGHNEPSRLPVQDLRKIEALAIKACQAVGISDGVAHVEIILTNKGPKLVELGARLGGDFITSHLVPLSTGVDLVKATIQIALGEKPDLTPKLSCGSAIRFFPVKRGKITKISGLKEAHEITGVIKIGFFKGVGDSVDVFKSSDFRVGYVIAQSNKPEKAVRICERALESVTIDVAIQD